MGEYKWPPASSGGSVSGPGSSTDNALARWDGTGGNTLQNSLAVVDDAGVLTGLTGLTSSGTVTFSGLTAGRLIYTGVGGVLTVSPITSDSSGNLASILTASMRNDADLSGAADAMLFIENRNDVADSHGHIQFKRGRASNADLSNDDTIGGINFHPRFGGSSNVAAQLEARYTGDGTTRLADFVFFTSNGGALAERVRITAAGLLKVAGLTATTVPYIGANKELVSSAVTPTELGYLSGVSSSIQTQLNGKQATGSYALTTSSLAQFASTTSLELKTLISDETGSGALVFADTPTLVTPVLGVASATSINNVVITAPGTSATLTLADGSTLSTSGAYSITLTATAATSVTLPTTGTLATLAGSENLTNKTYNKVTITAPATSATLTIANGKTFTVSNTLTFTGTDSSSVEFGGGGTVLYSGGALGTPSSGALTNCSNLPLSTGVTGTLPIGNGGTGQTTANAALNALLPSQTSNSGKVLTTDGTNTSWATPFTNPMSTLGDTIYGAASGVATRLAGDTTNTKKFLRSLSSGGVAAAPSWQEVDQVKGQTAGSAIASGYVGETSTASGSAGGLTTAQYKDATSITLSAGIWMIYGGMRFEPAGTTTVSRISWGISTTSGNSGSGLVANENFLNEFFPASYVPTDEIGRTLIPIMVNISGSTTYYLKCYSVFSTSTMNASGYLRAVRIS